MNKLPPFSEDAEKTSLGCLLQDADSLLEAINILNEEDFYFPPHKLIFTAIKNVYQLNKPVDILTVTQYLKENNLLEKIGGINYINEIVDSVPTTENFEIYLEIVKEKSLRRNLIKFANEIISYSIDNSLQFKDIIELIESKLLKITDVNSKENYQILKNLLIDIIDDITDRIKNDIKYIGLQTGYKNLDDLTSGFEKGDLIIIAARPSMGKTTFALNLAANMAFKFNYKVAFFSIEMPAASLGYKIISMQTKIRFDDIRKGNISYPKLSDLINEISNFYEKTLIFDDSSNLTLFDIQQRSRRIKMKYGLDVIFIDYLQLISPPKSIRPDNRNIIIGEISKGLKSLAKELQVPIIALSQLSRNVEKREDKRPMLSDLRESGSIEQDADIVAFLYREAYYKKQESGNNYTEFLIKKNRLGSTGVSYFNFLPDFSLFEEISFPENK